MGILDKAKATAGRVREQAAHGLEAGPAPVGGRRAPPPPARRLRGAGGALPPPDTGTGGPAETRAGEFTQGTLFWVDASATIDEALRQMEDHQVKRLPVIENHRLVGLISEADLARNLSEHRLAEFVEKVYGTR